MRKILGIVLCLLIYFPLNCESLKVAEERIKEIEEFKSMVCADASFRSEPLSDGEKEILKNFYDALENDEYEITSDDDLFFKVDGYDIEKNGWPVRYGFSFLDYAYSLQKNDFLLYSTVLERHYMDPEKMTGMQREDYENLVEEYDEEFMNGEKILMAKLKFRIRHWKNASEYMLEPVALSVYKIRFHEKKICDIPLESAGESFIVYPQYEFRTEAEFKREGDRIRRMKKSDAQHETGPKIAASDAEDEEERKDIQRKRNAVYGNFSLRKKGSLLDATGFEIDDFGLNLVFALTQHIYAGIGAQYSPREYKGSPVYNFEGKLGACGNLNQFIRPFIEVSGGGSTDVCAHISPGTGFDLLLSAVMLTAQYNYRFTHVFQEMQETGSKNFSAADAPTKCRHMFSVGLGIAW